MFSSEMIKTLFDNHKKTLKSLCDLERGLNERFVDMSDAVRCLILAVASGEPMLLLGPPGTGKSRLIRAFCQSVGLLDDKSMQVAGTTAGGSQVVSKNESYFEYLLTPFTEPSELFGYFDLALLIGDKKKLERADTGMMQNCRVVFLDEIFNASSAILNSLLTFMNERKFHDRGEIIEVALQCLFAATNYPPEKAELRAIYDRFLLRCWVDNQPPTKDYLSGLLEAGWRETYAPPTFNSQDRKTNGFDDLLPNLANLRADLAAMARSKQLAIDREHKIFAQLADFVANSRRADLSEMSNRRLVKMANVILIHRLLQLANMNSIKGNTNIMPEDLLVIARFGLDRHDPSFTEKLSQDFLTQNRS